MIKRPQRNLIFFLLFLFSPLIANKLGVVQYALAFTTLVLVIILVFGIQGRDFFIARYKHRNKNWEGAITSYLKFESFLSKLKAHHLNIPVFFSLYTYNGIALAKNNMAHCYMNNSDIETAETLFSQAVALDKLYALPHVNLAVIAAMDGDEIGAMKEADIAKSLGYRNKGIQSALRRILATTNESIGKVIS